jgi:Uncharacterized protein, similar to the N-terminal domain of Lon protease
MDCRFKDYGVLLEMRDCKVLDDGRMLVDAIGGRRIQVSLYVICSIQTCNCISI